MQFSRASGEAADPVSGFEENQEIERRRDVRYFS
jgi:hypothetical protein